MTDDEIRVLDEFEGEEYSRELVDVVTKEDKRTTAYAFYFLISVEKYADEIDFQKTCSSQIRQAACRINLC